MIRLRAEIPRSPKPWRPGDRFWVTAWKSGNTVVKPTQSRQNKVNQTFQIHSERRHHYRLGLGRELATMVFSGEGPAHRHWERENTREHVIEFPNAAPASLPHNLGRRERPKTVSD